MPYADSDFFLALLKPSDWLKEPAQRMLARHKARIWTSGWAVAELMFVAKELGLDAEKIVASVFEIAEVRGMSLSTAMAAAHLMATRGLGVFDSLHAATCSGDSIISSDHVFDKLGMQRIALE